MKMLVFIVSLSTYISILTRNLQGVFTPSTSNGFKYDFIRSVLNNFQTTNRWNITYKATLETNCFQFTNHKSQTKGIYHKPQIQTNLKLLANQSEIKFAEEGEASTKGRGMK